MMMAKQQAETAAQAKAMEAAALEEQMSAKKRELRIAHVRQLFESYTGQFDVGLQALGYSTPSALTASLSQILEGEGCEAGGAQCG
ncbi:hypothetical protein EON65_39585 [archaeon]|nr:MAG: hypothetical protein EON65_39585 [archaeon]